jgi:adenylate cyclase
MAHEIEYQYLVESNTWRSSAEIGTRITQGYLSIDPERTVRVRVREGLPATLTVKGRNHGAMRMEFEYVVPDEDARQILELCIEPLIHKTRYLVEHESFMWEIDVFDGANDGLILAEVEMDDEHTSPPLPDWVGVDVTHDPRFYNSNLVIHPYSSWPSRT